MVWMIWLTLFLWLVVVSLVVAAIATGWLLIVSFSSARWRVNLVVGSFFSSFSGGHSDSLVVGSFFVLRMRRDGLIVEYCFFPFH
jgi:hypothetical protein